MTLLKSVTGLILSNIFMSIWKWNLLLVNQHEDKNIACYFSYESKSRVCCASPPTAADLGGGFMWKILSIGSVLRFDKS